MARSFVFGFLLFLSPLLAHSESVLPPEQIRGEIEKVFCGKLNSVDDFGHCVLWTTKDSTGEKYAVVFRGEYLGALVPDGEENEILVRRIANFQSCEALDGKTLEAVERANILDGYTPITCYRDFTGLEISGEDALTPEDVSGSYANSRGDKATVTIVSQEDGDLFANPDFEIQVVIEKKLDDGSYEEFGIGDVLGSDEFYLVKKEQGSYFLATYNDDCQDPDCFNTDGIIKFIKNSSGKYTLYVKFDHYNNAPSGEEGVGKEYFDEEIELERF